MIDLDGVEEIRFEEPVRAERIARKALERAEGIEAARWCGVLGSCLRQLSRLPEARAVLNGGRLLAIHHNDPWGEADISQRMAYLVGADGRFSEAMTLTDLGMARFLVIGDFRKAGQCLADHAQWSYQLGNYAISVRANRLALRFLPRCQHRSRHMCFLGMAYALSQLGRTEEAIRAARRAASLPVEDALAGSASVFAGTLLEAKTCFLEAANVYLAGAAQFGESNPHEASLAALRAARMRLLAGEPIGNAEKIALGAVLVWSRNRQVEAALIEVRRLIDAGEIRDRHLASAILGIETAICRMPKKSDRTTSTRPPSGILSREDPGSR